MDEAEKRPRQHEDQPHKKADQAFQDGAADEQRRDGGKEVQPRAQPGGNRRRILIVREHPRQRLFPLFFRARLRFGRRNALPAQKFVAGHAE